MEINKQRIDFMDESKVSELTEIKIKHPSICYGCENARKPSSEKLIREGYVGCCIRMFGDYYNTGIYGYDWTEINEAKEIAEGWVDLKSRMKLGKGSGILTNLMLLTLEVKSCNKYE